MPLYTKESLNRLKEKINLEEVLSRHIELKRIGGSYKARCPFHEEKTPSFMIQKGQSHYHCFGCGAHGDAISFLMQYLKCSFGEAVRMLAEQFQVHLELSEEKEEEGIDKSKIKEALEVASRFFHFYLLKSKEGKAALLYLQKRGIDLKFIDRFKIGLSPENGALFKEMMAKKKISEEALLESGLLTKEKKAAFFRERITFPIHSSFGGIIGFSARKYREETFGGKYINSPETPLFKKSKTLFGLNYSRQEIAKQRKAVIVEGQIDCLRMIDSGLNQAVAALGTAFGEEHVRELKLLGVEEVTLLFDGDLSGIQAASKVGDLFQKKGIEVKVVSLPEKEDPDSFLRSFGLKSLLEVIEKAVDYLNFQVKLMAKSLDLKSPAKKSQLIHHLTHQIKKWEDPLMVHESLKKLGTIMNVPFEMMNNPLENPLNPPQKKKTSLTIDPDKILEMDLLRWLILCGDKKEFFQQASAKLQPAHFWTPITRRVFEAILTSQKENSEVDLVELLPSMDDEMAACIEEIFSKKINKEKAPKLFQETILRILDREWLKTREAIKSQIQSGFLSEEELNQLTKRFDNLKRPTL